MIQILKPGFYTTIQDMGRFNYQHYGVPIAGSMDKYSATYANKVLGNDQSCAVLEITMTGPTLKFKADTQIVISGADISPLLNNEPIRNNEVFTITKNSTLSFGQLNKGFRAYLAVDGGFNCPEKLNSRSTYPPVTDYGPLVKGMALPIQTNIKDQKLPIKEKEYDVTVLTANVLNVYKGPEFDGLSSKEQKLLTTTTFEIDNRHNRMAYYVSPLIPNTLNPILTSPVLPGTVQLTPSGQLIILMRDAQTTGGYPRILQLSETAINCLSQKSAGHTFKFKIVEIN